jgi:hypothetical protein
MLWLHKSWQLWLVSDQFSTSRLAKSTAQHKTQLHKTHNNQHEMPQPYPPADLPSPTMGRPAAPPTHGAAATKVPMQGVRRWIGTRGSWFPCLGCCTETHKKSLRLERSLPYGQNLIETHNNQPEINNSSRRDGRERTRGGWSIWGDVVPLFGWWLGQQTII